MDMSHSYFSSSSAILEAMPDAIVIVNHVGLIVSINKQTESLFGYQREELLNKFIEDLMPLHLRDIHPVFRSNYIKNPRVRPMGTGLELFGLKKNGDQFPIEISLSPLKFNDDTFVIAAIRDITIRKKAEAKFKLILEATPDCLVIINNEGKIVLVNGLTKNLFGYAKDELIGQHVEILIPNRYRKSHVGHRKDYFMQPRVRPMGLGLELYGLHRDGHEFPVEISLSPLETEEGLLALAAIRDITARKKDEDYKAMLSAIVHDSDDAIIGKNLDGTIFSWNNGAKHLYGYSAEEAIGENIKFLFPKDKKNEFEDILYKIKHGESVKHAESVRVNKEGEMIAVSVTISPIKNSKGNVIGASSVARDISKQKRLTEQLHLKNIELENANLAKDRFLANMSHELRTPLNAIIGYTGTLLMRLPGPLTADQEKQLKTVEMSAKHLLSIINDILDLAKIESGKVELKLEKINCNEVIKEVADFFKPLAQAKHIELKTEVPEQPLYGTTDRRALNQILINITNNALKFTDDGYILIKLYQKNIQHHDYVIISVTDTGIGIHPEDQKKLFKPFSFIEIGGRPYDGTGLGLYVSKKLADLIRAKITLESEYGRGTHICIFIPVK